MSEKAGKDHDTPTMPFWDNLLGGLRVRLEAVGATSGASGRTPRLVRLIPTERNWIADGVRRYEDALSEAMPRWAGQPGQQPLSELEVCVDSS